MQRVVLYTRAGCGLCDETLAELRRMQQQRAFEIDEVDIDGDAALRARFNDIIPVVEADGRILAQAPIDAGALRSVIMMLPA